MGKLQDLTNRRFGRLFVLRRAEKNSAWQKVTWWVRCDCGKELPVVGASLRRRLTLSCGCLKAEVSRATCQKSPRNLPLGRASRNSLLRIYKNNAARRGWIWNIDDKVFDFITQQPCHYCGVPPSNVHEGHNCASSYTYSGIDRLNSNRDYTKNNVVPSCKVCNRAKMAMSYEEFLGYLERVKNFRAEKGVQNGKTGLPIPLEEEHPCLEN